MIRKFIFISFLSMLIAVPELIAQTDLAQKSILLLKQTYQKEINQNLSISTNDAWRFSQSIAIGLTSNESFNLMAKIFLQNNKNISQTSFDNFMSSFKDNEINVSTSANDALVRGLIAFLKQSGAESFSTVLFNKNWQFLFRYSEQSIGAVKTLLPEKEAASSKTTPDLVWLNEISTMAADYYLKPYQDDPNDKETRIINGKTEIINRPDHGLAHAIRKTALMRDLLSYIKSKKDPSQAYAAVNQLSLDIKNFPRLMELAILLLRAGRQSEDLDNKYYKQYCINSAEIFTTEANKYKSLFMTNDIKDFAVAIRAMGDPELAKTISPKQKWIMNLLYAVHHLDLLRIPIFGGGKTLDVNLVKNAVAGFLQCQANNPLIKYLFDQSSKYLNATGDRNVPANKLTRDDKFFIQGNSPKLIFEAIRSVGGFNK
jgi:hypothetical protein